MAFVELILDGEVDGECSSLDLVRRVDPPLPLAEVIEMIRGCLRDEISEGSEGRHIEALVQTYRPEFETYLRGKLGMM